jgi:hypothetical protein|tara:strand:+ start:1340 stop:2239 length:900 start_codon:yes stop_codon:yes gene_type:complete
MFDEIGQDIEALFEGFEFSNTLRCSTVNNSGVRVTAEGILSSSDKNVSSLSMGQKKSPGSLVVENISITNEGRVSGEFSVKFSGVSKLYLSAQDERSEPGRSIKSSGKIGAEYRSEILSMDTSIDVINGPTGRATFLYAYRPWNIKFGANVQLNSHWDELGNGKRGKVRGGGQGVEVEDINFGLAYVTPGYQFHAKTSNYVASITLGYLHNVSAKMGFGAIIDYGFNTNSQNLVICGSYTLDEATHAKAKISSSAQMAGTLEHKLNKNVTLRLSSGVDMKDAMIPAKFGIGLVFDAEES